MYTKILWDLDNTLLNFTESEKYAFNACMSGAGLEPTKELLEMYSAINLSLWKRLERGEITKEYLLRQRFVSFFEAAGITGADPGSFQADYQRLLGSVYYYLDNSLKLVRKIAETPAPDGSRFEQYILSNGVASTQRSKLSLSGLGSYMDGLFISEEIGAEKPSPIYFKRCFSRIPNFAKKKCLLIGDSLTSDIQGANNAGIACCWYNPGRLKVPDTYVINYTIENLWDVLNILITGTSDKAI